MTRFTKTAALTLAAAFVALTPACVAEAQSVGGFFRQQDQPAVYYQFRADMHCLVQNEAQMAAYGGFGRVSVLPRVQMRGQYVGMCGFPNGFYRRQNQAAVYRLFGNNGLPNLGNDICHVVNEQQMAQFGGFGVVRVVPDRSDIGRGRGQIQTCQVQASGTPAGPTLRSGSYVMNSSNHNATVTLNVQGTNFSGQSSWQCCPSPRIDPIVEGRIANGRVTFVRDCRGQGYPGPCRQTYNGVISGNSVSGTWSGTGAPVGGGNWTMRLR